MAKKKKDWRDTMAATLGFAEGGDDIAKSADDDADLEKARKMVPPAGDDDEDTNAPSQEDLETSAAPGKAEPPVSDDADGDGEDDDESAGADDDDEDNAGGDDDGDEDDEDFKGEVIRRSQANPELLKSMFMDAPDLLKSLFEGEGGQQIAELLDASDTVGFIVDTFDRLLSQQQRDHNLVVKSMEIRMSEMSDTLELLGQGLTEAVTVLKSLAEPDLVKSRAQRAPVQRIGSGLGALMPPRRVDPATEEPATTARRSGGKAKREALTEEAQNVFLKSRLPVRHALMQGVSAGLIAESKAADHMGKLNTAEGVRDALAFMAQIDAKPEADGFFKSLPGVDALLGRDDILIKAS